MRRATLALALASTVLVGCGSEGAEGGPAATVVVDDPDGLHGSRLPRPYDVPDVTFTDTEGQPYSLTTDSTRPWTLVFFGYTNCPDVCQLVMSSLASALTRLPDDERQQVQVLLVTSDPARDTPAVMRSYLDRFDGDFEGLTAPLRTVVEVGDALGVEVGRGQRLPSGGREVVHGANVVAIDSHDEGSVVWTQGTSPSEFAEDLHALLAR